MSFSERMKKMSFGDYGIGIGSYAFLIFLFILSALWVLTLSFGINVAFANTYQNLTIFISLLFLFNFIVSAWESGTMSVKNMKFAFLNFAETDEVKKTAGSIALILVVSLLLGGLFFVSGLKVPVSSTTVAVFEETPSAIQNQFNALLTTTNFTFIPAVQEEIFFFLGFLTSLKFFTKIFNKDGSEGRQLTLFLFLLIAWCTIFTVFHYDKTIKELQSDYDNYKLDPSGWARENPQNPVPPNPSSTEAFSPFFGSLFWLFSFKLLNSLIALYFGSIWIAILTHFINNAAQLVTVATLGLTALAIPYVLFIFFSFIMLLFIERRMAVGD